MSMKMRRIAVTGAGGQIAYSLIFRLAQGELFGDKTPIALHLLEVPQVLESLRGVQMELEDCAFPLLKEVRIGSDPNQVFEGTDTVFLVGSKPRGPGMERKDLLSENGHIFVGQGKAIGSVCEKGATVLVVGNPCNTNCLIAKKHAGKHHFYSMTRLDQNRATTMLAKKAGADVTEVSHVTIWGNHSSTQVPDFLNAKIKGKSVTDMIHDRPWLEGPFISDVQKRGAVVIAARGKSSAASAAHAALGAMQSLVTKTREGEWFSMGVASDGNPYGIAPGLVFSFPCRSDGQGTIEIVKNLKWDSFLEGKIRKTEKELLEEKSMVQNLL
jgi:malate dehydrogenase